MKQLFYIIIAACCIFALSSCGTTSELKRTPIMDGKVIGPYSSAQLVGNTLYVSGQIGLNQETGQMENGSIESETKQVLANLSHVLKTAGFTENDVVSTTVYLKDMKDFSAMNTIYGGFFHEGNYPARCTVQIAALPRDARIEISAVAVKTH